MIKEIKIIQVEVSKEKDKRIVSNNFIVINKENKIIGKVNNIRNVPISMRNIEIGITIDLEKV